MESVTIPVWSILATVTIITAIIGGLFSIAHSQLLRRLTGIENGLEEHGKQARDGIAEVHRRLDEHISYHLEG